MRHSLKKMEISFCFCCCFSPLYEHTALRQLFPFVALRHADVTLRLTGPVWTTGHLSFWGPEKKNKEKHLMIISGAI